MGVSFEVQLGFVGHRVQRGQGRGHRVHLWAGALQFRAGGASAPVVQTGRTGRLVRGGYGARVHVARFAAGAVAGRRARAARLLSLSV